MHRHCVDRFKKARNCVEIAPDVCLEEVFVGDDLAGFVFAHNAPDRDTRCEHAIPVHFARANRCFEMTGSLRCRTLTLAPGISCPNCGFGGTVSHGQWVSA